MLPLRMLGPLMFMFLLCDADSMCPDDINPLTLDPPRVIGKPGESFDVNCSSVVEDHDGISWRYGTSESAMEEENVYVPWSLTLIEGDVTAECKIKLNDTLECCRELEVTVYKDPDLVIFPINHKSAVEGMLYELQCDIFSVPPVQNFTVRWYKDNQAIKTEHFTNISKTLPDESSTLGVNMSRRENDAEFRCEVQLTFGPHGPHLTVISDIQRVTVHYAPELKNMTDVDDVNVDEGNDVTLNCDAEGFPRPVFKWTHDGVNILENTNNLHVTRLNTSAYYSCTATNDVGSIMKQFHVHVTKPFNTATPAAMTQGCPLILTPRELVVKFGDPASINCSTAAMDATGMGWEAPFGGTGFEKPPTVTWQVQELRQWGVAARCYVTLSDGVQCTKTPAITVYKTPDTVSITALAPGPMLEGKEYKLNCSVTNVAPVQKLKVNWYRGNESVHTKDFRSTSLDPLDKFSILTVSPERHYNGTTFRCQAELHLGPKGPEIVPMVTSSPYTAIVHYAPELKNMTDVDDVNVDEGNDVTLNCDAEGFPRPVFKWTRDGVNILENTNNLHVTRVNTSANYSCTATNDVGSIMKQFHVHVIKPFNAATPAAMTTPEVSTPKVAGCPLILTPSELVVKFGDPALINCSTAAMDASGMGWEAAFGGTGFEKPPTVTWQVHELRQWGVAAKCYITMSDGDQCTKTPAITVYKTPDTVSITALDPGPMLEGKEYKLNCSLTNVAPVQKLKVNWYRGNESVHTKDFRSTSLDPLDKFSILTVSPERHYNGTTFRCQAELHLGPKGPEIVPMVTSSPYTAIVHYKPLAPACPGGRAGVEHEFRLDMLSCEADGNPAPTVHWSYEGHLVDATERLDRTQSGKYTATFKNSLGSFNTSVDIIIEYRPSFTCNGSYEVTEDKAPTIQCEPEGIPEPTVTWIKDGKEMATPRRWTKHDSGTYTLRATNTRGTATQTLKLDVLYAPVFKDGNHTQMVTPGENVMLGCSAEGNPFPAIHWNYTGSGNVKETSGGRYSNIIITGATSTNAGVYSCVATNNVGTVTRSVTLMMRAPVSWIWILLIILILILILILLAVCLQKCRKKHGQYSFVPVNGTDSIPMATTQEKA